MKTAALLVSALILLGYVALMRIDPAWGFLHPRGGMVTLAISLALANAGIRLSAQRDRAPNTRFQLAAAGWIWLVVQGGSMAYLYLV